MNSNNTLSISSGTIIRGILIILAFYLMYILRDIVLVIVTSITIAASVEPGVRALIKKRVPRTLAVIGVFLSGALIIAGGLYFFLPAFIDEAVSLFSTLPSFLDNSNLWNPLASFSFGNAFSLKDIITSLSSTLNDVTGGVFTTLSGAFGGVISFILIIVLSFYFSVQEDGIGKFLGVITPDHYEKYILNLWRRAEQKIGLWLQGQLLLAVIVGLLTFLGLSVIGMRSAMILAILAAFLELIPIFGIILALIPAVSIALIDGGVTLALIVLGLYIIIQQFENHLIYPLVVRKIVGIPPILVILTLIIGIKLAGFLGAILSVPVAAVFVEIYNDIERKKINRTNE